MTTPRAENPVPPGGTLSLPAGRYPSERSPQSRRRWSLGLTGLVIVVGIGIAFFGYTRFADEPVKGTDVGYEIIDSSTIKVRFTVDREDPSQPVSCVVRARSKDGSESGRREVLIPPARASSVEVLAAVRTSQPPVMGTVYGCTRTVPDYLRADPAVAIA